MRVIRCLGLVGAFLSAAAIGGAAVWEEGSRATVGPPPADRVLAGPHRILTLDRAAVAALLASAPLERTDGARVVLELPWPSGGFRRFAVEVSPVMEPGLAAQLPGVSTYRGRGLDDRTALARLDLTPAGFHAIVLSAEGTVYVDPWDRDDPVHYVAYFKRDYRRREPTSFRCHVGEPDAPVEEDLARHFGVARAGESFGDTLRTYRLALAATGEYTVFHGGTAAAGQAAIVVAVNRVNAVYERDLAVHMNLVANNINVVYTDGATDPYTNDDGFAMLFENQSNLDAVIGSANYDIGHVFSTGGGGIAGLGVVCTLSAKARGVTGLSNPTGDPFYIDYVAHEMGHQFAGNHSFNGTTGACAGNGGSQTAWEPGSGSTVMAYAGICGAEDLQPHSDDLFHVGNLAEMQDFISTGFGSQCPVATPTGNLAPTVNAGADFTIPQTTPFTLTATGSDPEGAPLLWIWEELDTGTAAPPNTDDGSRPIFRSFNVTTSPSRTLPRLADVLAGLPTPTFGEAWPTTDRTLNFRATARDNHAGAGATTSDAMVVTVSAGAGPFQVTAPNTAVTWTGGSTRTVTWSVANTNAPPVSAASVRISLSTDGGNTFPTVLQASTPNDGSEDVVVPNTPTTQARVKVEAVGNIFFDIGNADFTIVGGVPALSIGDRSVVEGNAGTTQALFTVTLAPSSGSPVTVDFATADGTATTADNDYLAATGTLTFAPGQTSRTVTVSVVGDTTPEPSETFFVNLTNPNGATVNDGQGLGTIVNDDGGTVISISDASIVEGNAGTVNAFFSVTLDSVSAGTVLVNYATADGTATSPGDYEPRSGVLSFAPGFITVPVTVTVIGDLQSEPDETFFVNLSSASGGTIGDGQGVGTIVNDDDSGPAELVHGTSERHALASLGGLPNTDTYRIDQKPQSSYEVVVDEVSGDLAPIGLDRIAPDGTTVVQSAQAVGTGTARSLRWQNQGSTDVTDETVRVASGDCTSDCGADDTYRVRAYETTVSIPRFNNAGSQVTVLLLQNPTDQPIAGRIYFWNTVGQPLAEQAFTLGPKSLMALNTSTVPGLTGNGGSVTISHDGRYGELAGKSVALEPATGFSFDSPMVPRPR